MSFDQSRSSANPWSSWRDFLGVVMQQGRVQLDSDWNEWLAEVARRIQVGTLDLVGVSGVPSTTPFGFKINANAVSPAQITISAGRIYVDGLLAENHGPKSAAQWDPSLGEWSGAPQPPGGTPDDLDFTQQPYLPGATVHAAKVPYIVYLDLWQREVTYLECSELIDPAVGVDTTGRLQTVWQVKQLDVSSAASSLRGGLTSTTPDASITNWQALIQPSSSQLTTVAGASGISGTCALNSGGGYTGLENQLYRVAIFQGGAALSGPPGSGLPPSGTATFVWSRENGSVATAVNSIAPLTANSVGNPASQLTVQSMGRDQVLGFKAGDWIEITSEVLELNFQPGELHQIDSIDTANKTITLDSTVSSTYFPAGQTTSNTRIRRWDQSGTVYLADGATVWTNLNAPVSPGVSAGSAGIPIPPPNVALLLEDGVAVSFGPIGNSFNNGEYWTITARAADGSIESLNNAPPAGIRHHYCRLAIVDFSATPPVVKDCRRVFPALANPCIHVTEVLVGGAALVNGSTVSIQDLLAHGLTINFDGTLDPAMISSSGSGSPICTLTVDLPAAAPAGGGFSPLILGATVQIGDSPGIVGLPRIVGLPKIGDLPGIGDLPKIAGSPNTLQWNTNLSSAAQTALESLFPAATPFVAHLTLKGALIWAQGQPCAYLNGAGDGRPSADFQLWFWLNSQPPTTISATSIVFATPQVVGSPASQAVTLTNHTAAAITITSINFSGTNAADFSQTNTGMTVQPNGGTCTITVTFTPHAVGTSSALMSITDSADSASQTITLSGTAIQPGITASAGSLTFPSTVASASSAVQSFVLTNTGNSLLTISGISIINPVNNPNFVLVSGGLSGGTSGTLQAGQQCTVQVQFTPKTSGVLSGTLSIAHNAPQSPLLIGLTGTAFSPAPGLTSSASSLNFGSVGIGAAPTLSVTLNSTGNTALDITAYNVSGAGFTLAGASSSSGGLELQPGAQCVFTVKFNPTSAGTFNGNLSITHNASGSPLNISLSGTGVGLAAVSASSTNLAFGAVLIGDSNDRSVTLTSTGTAPLTISGTAIQGVGAGMYAITSNTYSGSLAAGATCTIDVTFNPTSIGAHPASLSITTNASAAPLVVTLSGNGTKKAAKEGSDKLISIEKVNENQMSVARQAREGVLPPANALASAASAPAATSQAFIQPAERPVVGAEPASPAEAQTPAAKPVEGPKKG